MPFRHPAELPPLRGGEQNIGVRFTDTYKEQIFWMWYRAGKPNSARFYPDMIPSEDNIIPAEATLKNWIGEFQKRAEPLDLQVREEMQRVATQEKVEMLRRHSDADVEMQNIAIEYLKEHKEQLNPSSAVRRWVEGVRVERESRGLPTLITQTVDAFDEKLMESIEKLLSTGNFDDLDLGEINGSE